MKKYKAIDIYDFSDYAEEITGNALFAINGGAQIENSVEAQANAQVGDTLTRKDGTTVTITQGDINWAQQQLAAGATGVTSNGNSGSGSQGNPEQNNTSTGAQNYSGGSNQTTSENHPTVSIDIQSIPENIRNNPHALAAYLSKQAQAQAEGEPDRYKGYNVLGEELKGNEVYFIYVYKTNNPDDQKMKAYERSSINEEVGYLIKNGVSVKVIEAGNYYDIKKALEDHKVKMIVTSGHGSDGGYIETANNRSFSPSHLKDINISETLKTVIFENCYQGGTTKETNDLEIKWETAFGGFVDVVGWRGQTSKYETKRFNNSGLFDRQQYNLMDYCRNIVNEKN